MEVGVAQAVDGVSFSVERSQTLGIVGESGCGKSTLALALMRLLPSNGTVNGGEIRFNGEDILQMSDARLRAMRWQEISMIFQAAMNSLNPVIRVGDLMTEALQTHEPVSKQEARRRAAELFEMVGLEARHLRSYPHELSGGMKQRAVIAMSLICSPNLVIADEPTTALDVVVQDQILRRLKTLGAELGIGMIVISHDLGVIAEVCDTVAVMYAGQIVEYGDVRTIFNQPRHPYTIALMHSIPTLTGPVATLASIPGSPPSLLNPPHGCRFAPRCLLVDPLCDTDPPPDVEVTLGHRSRCHFATHERITTYCDQ
jgi:peptide/nickel transport system ATP-binding protein